MLFVSWCIHSTFWMVQPNALLHEIGRNPGLHCEILGFPTRNSPQTSHPPRKPRNGTRWQPGPQHCVARGGSCRAASRVVVLQGGKTLSMFLWFEKEKFDTRSNTRFKHQVKHQDEHGMNGKLHMSKKIMNNMRDHDKKGKVATETTRMPEQVRRNG